MLRRREFISMAAAGAAVTGRPIGAAGAGPTPQRKRALMKLGCQSSPTDAKRLQFFARHGVNNICGYPDRAAGRDYSTVEELVQLKERAAKYGVSVDWSRRRSSRPATSTARERPAIMLGQSPERDRDIEQIQNADPELRQSGHPADQVQHEPARRGAHRSARPAAAARRYSTWRLKEAKPATRRSPRPAGERGPVLGAHHLFPGSRDSGRQRVQGPHGLPPARSRHAARKAIRESTPCSARPTA